MSRSLSRFVAAAVLAVSGLALTSMAFDADAARVGKGGNSGRQSSNVSNQAPAASTTTQKSATAPAAAARCAAKRGSPRARPLPHPSCGEPSTPGAWEDVAMQTT